jgi:putative flippase GtrA
MTSCFIIPAYEPNHNLITLLQELTKRSDHPIFVIDDDSTDKSVFKNPIFLNEDITLLKHAGNLGKGAALKTAFNHVIANYPSMTGCVTLDADGQHAVEDVIKLSLLNGRNNQLVLGVRNFSFKDKNIPLKSRIGNLLTRCIWGLMTRKMITDTQTGLRKIPARLMRECLHIAANRYEFEMEMLLKAQALGMETSETPISTIYIDNNKESHFNPVFDSLKIYFIIFRFCLSSLFSYGVDCLLFFIFIIIFSLSASSSFIIARIIAGFFNYNINKTIVFNIKKYKKIIIFKYFFIFFINLYLGFVFINTIESYGYNVFYAKILAECVLFFFNFFLQKEWVFKKEIDAYE